MSILEQDLLSLCFDIEEFNLLFDDLYQIRHDKVGNPMRIFKIRQGDTAPVLKATLQDKNEEGVFLSAYNPMKFIMREDFTFERETEQINVQESDNIILAPQNDTGNQGKFQYNWEESDTAESGTYIGLFEIMLNGIQNSNIAPYRISDGDTLEIAIDGGSTQTFTFNVADFATIIPATVISPEIILAEAQEIVDVINATITDGIAAVSDTDKRVVVQSLDTTLDGSVQIVGGTANDILLFDTLLTKNRRISLPEKGISVKIIKSFDED